MAAAAVVAVAGLASFWSMAGATPSRASAVEPCVDAVLIDGAVRCDEEIPVRVADLCGGEGPDTPDRIAAGDAFDTGRLCGHTRVRRGDATRGWTRMDGASAELLHQPVDVNTASLEELQSLPRIGPALSQRVVEGRPYATVDDLLRVRGIGPTTLERLRARARVASRHRPTTD